MQWLMLQQDEAEDFVIATGEQHSVREFVIAAAAELGVSLSWKGSGVAEKGYDARGNCIVQVDPRYFRPSEVDSLMGDATKARIKLGWQPRVNFQQLVREMVASDLQGAQRDQLVKASGYKVYEYRD
jgi:GDPmannose 4,6-dehydratase